MTEHYAEKAIAGEVKPCPFCGNQPRIVDAHESPRSIEGDTDKEEWLSFIECDCIDMFFVKGSASSQQDARDAVRKAWNRREPARSKPSVEHHVNGGVSSGREIVARFLAEQMAASPMAGSLTADDYMGFGGAHTQADILIERLSLTPPQSGKAGGAETPAGQTPAPSTDLLVRLASALEDILPWAEEKWANPDAISEIVNARECLRAALATEGSADA